MLQPLALLEGFDLAAMGHRGRATSTPSLECAKLAFADREAWYGDPAFVDVPLETLLSAAYADERRALVGERASFELRPGSPDGREPRLPPCPAPRRSARLRRRRADARRRGGLARATRATSTSSTATATWSRRRRAAAGCTAPRRSPASASAWARGRRCSGSTEGLPNSLEPGKRPRTTLTPTLGPARRRAVHGDRARRAATGRTSGSCSSRCSATSTSACNLQEAIDAPAFHSNHLPSSFYPRDVRARAGRDRGAVGRRRSRAARAAGTTSGSPAVVARAASARWRASPTGCCSAAANPRGMQGYAVGR